MPGGIDLNPDILNLQTNGETIETNNIYDEEFIQSLQVDGFIPVIFQIVPTTNLPMLIGWSENDKRQQLQ